MLAKGVQREKHPLWGMLDLPFRIQAQIRIYPERDLHLLTNAELIDSFSQLRLDLGRYYLTLYAGELVEEAGAPAGSEHLFELFERFLHSLNRKKGHLDTLRIGFEINFLKLTGLEASFEDCALCGKPIPPGSLNFFSPANGGSLCLSCRKENMKNERIAESALRIAARLSDCPWSEIERIQIAPAMLRQIRRALDGFLRYHWERLPRTHRQLEIAGT